jgi:two-component system, LytTR family, sensor kinase
MNAVSNTKAATSKWMTWLQRTALATVIWTAIGCVFALPNLLVMMPHGVQWERLLLGSFVQWWAWGLLAPLIVSVDLRLPFSQKQIVSRIVAHLFLAPIFTAAYLYLEATLAALMGWVRWSYVINPQLLPNALRGMFLWSVLVYCLIVGVFQAKLYYQRYLSGELRMEQLERSFSQARLNALRMQLDPHFLFNALNTISAQVEREPRLARQMIEHLGDLLRLSLENKDRQEVPLIEEMAFLEHYLAIQRIRFGDRLRFATEIAPEVKYAMVPCLVVQPLVENAIRHGLSSRATGGSVLVSARKVEKQLEICVTDDGVGLPPGWTLETSAGLGLSVTQERVHGLHPNGGSRFAIRRLRQGTEAVIRVPLRFDANPNEVDEPLEASDDPAAD